MENLEITMTVKNALLDDITVLILSHNRQNCLVPSLLYWNQLGIKTIVIDESPKPLKDSEQFLFTKYVHLQEPFNERCKIASSLLESKYSIIAQDLELF